MTKRLAERLLLGPGPSPVPPEVLHAMSAPTLGHLDPDFGEIMSETMDLLRTMFGTNNNITVPVSGTGSAGMEASIVNFIESTDRVVVSVAGVFGGRLADTASRTGADVCTIDVDWGSTVDPDIVKAELSKKKTKALVVVHAETSTGARQRLADLAKLAHEHGALFIVDAVTSLGGIPVNVDETGIDVCYSGTQKCISCPPGLAPLTVSDRALKVLENRSSPVPSWYLDLSMICKFWGSERLYHHTAPINMMYALNKAAQLIVDEGLDEVYERHERNMNAMLSGLSVLGLEPVPKTEERLNSLAVVKLPGVVDDGRARIQLLTEHQIEIGGGLGDLKGKVWRIGLMGHGSRRHNVNRLIGALGSVLTDQGISCDVGQALAAVNQAYR